MARQRGGGIVPELPDFVSFADRCAGPMIAATETPRRFPWERGPLARVQGGGEGPATLCGAHPMSPTTGRTKAEDYIGAPNRPFTGKEYLESLRDGREIYVYGERVSDVTTHHAFRNAARTIAK